MKIVLMNQFFWPDTAATSQLLTDLARALAAAGHDVHIVCGSGQYAAVDCDNPPPVTIHRTPTLPFARGKAARVLSYASYLLCAMWEGLRGSRPDVVVTMTTPPLLSVVGALVQRLRGVRHFIWEMDVYPDVAIALGHLSAGSPLARAIGLVADWTRRRADGVLTLGECMRDRLQQRGIPAERLYITENWADGSQIVPQPMPPEDGPVTLLYSGNLGLAHDVDTIREVLAVLGSDARFRFVFAGGGARREELRSWCATHAVQNVEFPPHCLRSQLGDGLAAGHLGLVTQRDDCLGAVVPSKVYGLMAAGRPVLFIGPASATPARIIHRHECGWAVPCGDAAGLIRLLEDLAANRGSIGVAGRRARAAFDDYYDLPHAVARISAVLGTKAAPQTPAAVSVATTYGS